MLAHKKYRMKKILVNSGVFGQMFFADHLSCNRNKTFVHCNDKMRKTICGSIIDYNLFGARSGGKLESYTGLVSVFCSKLGTDWFKKYKIRFCSRNANVCKIMAGNYYS